MSEDAAESGQEDKHVLAETQVAGFGMANGKVVERLLIEFDRETPAAKLVHERLDYAEPLRDRDPKLETLREIVANPHDSHRDGEQKLETGSGYGKDRVIVDRHGHARRIYIRHEHFDNGEWTEAAAWELHPATGVEEFGTDLVTDGGTELGVLCDVDDCENRIVGLDDGWEFSRGTVCQDCIDYQSRHGHWPDESVDICAECRIDDGMIPHECEESSADRVLIEPGTTCDYCGFEAAVTDGGQRAEDGRVTAQWLEGRYFPYPIECEQCGEELAGPEENGALGHGDVVAINSDGETVCQRHTEEIVFVAAGIYAHGAVPGDTGRSFKMEDVVRVTGGGASGE